VNTMFCPDVFFAQRECEIAPCPSVRSKDRALKFFWSAAVMLNDPIFATYRAKIGRAVKAFVPWYRLPYFHNFPN